MARKAVGVNRLSFINGRLVPKGGIGHIEDVVLKPRGERGGKSGDDNTRPRNSNLVPIKGRPVPPPEIEVAAIGPTGPNPTMPQQVPPGTIQTGAGHFNDGNRLVAEGTRATSIVDDTGNDEVEEEDTSSALDDGMAEDEDDGDDGGSEDEQVASAVVEGTVAEVERAVTGLSASQLDAVEKAEKAGQGRSGVLNAVKAARANLPK